MDYNCYWDLRNNMPPKFLDNDWKAWKGIKDKHSIIQDPAFKDPYRLDFHFKNQKAIRKSGSNRSITKKPVSTEVMNGYKKPGYRKNGKTNSTGSYGKEKSRYRHCLNKVLSLSAWEKIS